MVKQRPVIAAFVLLTLLTGCRPLRPMSTNSAKVPQGTSATNAGNSSNTPNSSDLSANTTSQFPNPGPFHTLEIKKDDGTIEECLQARGELGKPGGTLTLSTFGSGVKTFNNWAASDVESDGIGLLQNERLCELDPWTGEYYPRLAKKIDVSADGKQYTFTLRKGLEFSDGHPLTADDVVYTFQKIVKEGYGNSSARDVLSVYGKFPKVEKVNDLTVRFTTATRFAPFLAGVRSVGIAPKHILEKVTARPLKDFNQFWSTNTDPSTLVGSGAFILERYVPSQRLILKKNPRYFMVDKNGTRLPYLDKFVVAVVPSQKVQILKFLGGELDMLDIRSIPGNEVAKMKQHQLQGNYSMYNLGPDDGTVFLMFNLCRRKNPKGKFYVDPIKQKWFNNQKFRQAVSHAIDRKRIIDNVLKGVGAPLFTAESPTSLYVNKDLKPYDGDLQLAAKLLKEGGFILKPSESSNQLPSGRLYDADGHPIEFVLMTNSGNPSRDGICVTIVDTLAKLGIKVFYQPVDFNVLVDKTETSLDWEAIVMGLSGDKIEPYNGANVWKSDGRIHMFDQRLENDKGQVIVTDARDWEKEIDKLFDEGAVVLGFEKRKPYYWKYQQIAYDQQPFIYIDSMLDITAVRNTIGNYRPHPLGINYTPQGSLHNIEEIYFKTGGRPH